MEERLLEIGMSLATPLLIGVFGFLWRVNSKLASIEKTVEAHDRRIANNSRQLTQHFEKAFTIRKDAP